MARTSFICQWNDDEVCFVLDQHAELDFYSASSLKQQTAGKHVTPLGHIILIPSQPVFALSTNCIVFDLTRSMLEHTIYSIQGERAYHYTTDSVQKLEINNITTFWSYKFSWKFISSFMKRTAKASACNISMYYWSLTVVCNYFFFFCRVCNTIASGYYCTYICLFICLQ